MLALPARVLYNPVGGTYKDKQGVMRPRRVHGHMQASFPGFNVRWNRDINAAINILKLFHALYKDGEVPWEFRRSTDKAELVSSPAARYKYKCVPGKKGYIRV